LHQLERPDLLVELFPCMGIFEGKVEGSLHDPTSQLDPFPIPKRKGEEVHTLMAHRLGLASRGLIPTSRLPLLLRLYQGRFLVISLRRIVPEKGVPSGISTLSKNNSAVGDPRIYHQYLPIKREYRLTPNLSKCSPTSNPLLDLSTMNAVNPFEAGPSVPVLA
jgi:hypothetical protein